MKSYRVIIYISLICLFCYYKTFEGSFVFDDIEAVVKNKDILSETPLKNLLKNDFWGTSILKNESHKSYRPITILSYRLNNYLSNENKPDPYFYHVVNVILYTILCILFYFVFLMFYRIFYDEVKSKSMAILTSFLYCVHPIHVEPVAAIVGRADLLCAIFYTITILVFKLFCLNNNFMLRIFYFILCLSSTILSMFSKETGVTVLVICIIYDTYTNRDIFEMLFKRKFIITDRSLSLYIRIFIISLSAILLLYVRWWIMDFQIPIFQKMDNPASFSPFLLTRVLSYNYIYALNLILLIWPNWLCFDWAMGCLSLVSTFDDYRILLIIAFWFISIAIILKVIKRKQGELFFPIILIVIPFIPASNIIRVGFVIAERTLLIPSAGFCMLIVIGFSKIKKLYPQIAYLTFTLLIITFILKVHIRNNEWLTEQKLYTSALSVCPNNAKVHYNIAKIEADEGNIKKAIREYRIALSLYPDYDHAMNNLANILRDAGEYDEAESLLKRALELRSDFAAAWMNLGIVQMNKNQQKQAEVSFMNALKYRPKYADCYYNLGNLYLNLNRHSEALNAWRTAIQLKPLHKVAWNNLLILLDSLGRTEESILTGYQALKLLPNEPSVHFNVGNSLGKAQRWSDAEHHFQMAIQLNPNNALYYSNLGVLYHRWNKFEEAANYYKIALRLDPNLKSARDNLLKLNNK